MAMRPDEIVAILRRQIEEFRDRAAGEDLGSVLMVGTESPAFMDWEKRGPPVRGVPR